jgi:hypothetical protein
MHRVSTTGKQIIVIFDQRRRTTQGRYTMKNKYEQTFVPKLRFPEFEDGGEWEEISLNELGRIIGGLTYSPDDLRESGLLVLRSHLTQRGSETE